MERLFNRLSVLDIKVLEDPIPGMKCSAGSNTNVVSVKEIDGSDEITLRKY